MKVKFGDLTVRQVKKICDKAYPSCGKCQLAPNGACLLACSLSDKAISMEYETEMPDEEVGKDGTQ